MLAVLLVDTVTPFCNAVILVKKVKPAESGLSGFQHHVINSVVEIYDNETLSPFETLPSGILRPECVSFFVVDLMIPSQLHTRLLLPVNSKINLFERLNFSYLAPQNSKQ
jgi:hypothetical protein